MTRFAGKVGFVSGQAVEVPPDSGIWVTPVEEREYQGNVLRDVKGSEPGDGINSNLKLDNRISIVSDRYAIEHLRMIKYVDYDGDLWSVTSVEIQRPRLILSIGGVYNGPTP